MYLSFSFFSQLTLVLRAKQSLVDVYEADYAPVDSEDPQLAQNTASTSHFAFGSWAKKVRGAKDGSRSVVEAYLSEPVEVCDDPIAYWRGQIVAGRRVELAQMALDYLTIPCAFSL